MAFSGVQVVLRNEATWKKMAPNAEVMITKPGRRLIPGLELDVTGLSPEASYSFRIGFERLDNFKFKYTDGQWQPGSDAEEFDVREYKQPDGWQSGQKWMETGVSFAELKITSDPDNSDPEFIVLRTLYKYCPVVTMTMGTTNNAPTSAVLRLELATFYAVSGHVNPRIVELKAEFNKTANKGRKRARNDNVATTSGSVGNRPKRAAPRTSHAAILQLPTQHQQPDQQQLKQRLEPERHHQQLQQYLGPQQQQYGLYMEPNQKLQQLKRQHFGIQRQSAHPADPWRTGHVQRATQPQQQQYWEPQERMESQHHHQLQQQHLEVQQHLAHPMDPSEIRRDQQHRPVLQLQQFYEPPVMQRQDHQQPEQFQQQLQQQLPVRDQQTADPVDPWQVAPYAEVPQESSNGRRVFRTPTMEELKQLCPRSYYRH